MTTASRDLAHQAFDAVDVGLIALDADAVVCGWNAWIARATTISAEFAIGKQLPGVLGVVPPQRLSLAIQHAIRAGASSVLTHTLHPGLLPLVSRLGAPILHNVSVVPLGEPGQGCLIQVLDVTASVSREVVLRERQNARFNAVVDGATDAIVTIDGHGLIQWMNRSAELTFGLVSADATDKPVSILIGENGNLAEAIASLGRAIETGRVVETPGRTRAGSVIDLELSASSWHGQGRKYITAILRDIGERKASERALLSLNQSLETTVAARTEDRDRVWRLSSDLMFNIQPDGRIAASNPAATSTLGWSEVKLQTTNIRDLVVGEDLAIWDTEVGAARASRQARRFDVRLRTKDRKTRWLEWSVVASEQSIQAVGRDVTVEKDTEAALRSAEDALRQSQKMEAIGQLTGGIAHDFNNLLAGVIGGLEIIKRRVSTGRYEDLNRFMEASINSAQRAAAMTHRLLAFSRQQPLDARPHDVNAIVKDMEELMRRSLGEQVRLVLQLGAGLDLAATDANQLENAILNMVINARDAMPEGGQVTISTARADEGQLIRLRGEGLAAEGYVALRVADTGSGMTPEIIAKVFDPFFTTKPVGKGTGLGLSMIYGFAKQSKGHVEVESTVGKGTAFTLYLPQTHERAGDLKGETLSAPLGAGETVLIVEDDAAVRMLISDVLDELGYTPIEVGDGRAALPILRSDARIDLMISDVGLPGLNGRQLAQIAREHRPDLKVLFVTGYAQHATVRDEFLLDGMDMITKPFALDILGTKIQTILSTTR